MKLYMLYVLTGLSIQTYLFLTHQSVEDVMDTASLKTGRRLLASTADQCVFDSDCHHGKCVYQTKRGSNGTYVCECDHGYITHEQSGYCNYHQRSQTVAFLLSLFLGEFGADWFYIGAGNSRFDGIGVLKLFTIGGFFIWWLVDWIRIAVDPCNFRDSNGACLAGW